MTFAMFLPNRDEIHENDKLSRDFGENQQKSSKNAKNKFGMTAKFRFLFH